MNEQHTTTRASQPSGLFSVSRVVLAVGSFALCSGLTVTACIQSRYTGIGPATDGAVSSDAGGFDAARFDAAGVDAAGVDAAGVDAAGVDAAVADAATFDAAQVDGARDLNTADAARVDAAVPPDLSSPPTDDPFDPGSCSGPAISSTQALALLGTATRVKLADATLYRRTRTCPAGVCGAWSTPVVHTQSLLTYSGGVTTDYKTFSFPTHLIVFAQTGVPKFVVRHETDYRHDASANTRGVVFGLGADPMVNTYPVINVWDFAPAPSRYEDLAGLMGDDGFLHASEHCARLVFVTGMTTEIAALYKY